MGTVLNFEILRQPFNWLTVVLMVAFGMLFLAIVFPPPSSEG